MWPLDSKGLFSSHGRGDRLPSLSLRLSTDHLLHLNHIYWVQVIKRSISNMYLSPSRLCDSRNLNLSPFCNLATSSLVKWEPSIRATYENISTSYTTGLPGPMRPKYPPSMVERELISSLTKVNKFRQTNYSIGHTFNDQFTLSRWSIYSLKGKPGLQRLWKGHCSCQSVLWRLNCVWWFA